MYALGHAPFTYFECGSYAKATAVVDELAALADEKCLFWKAEVTLNQGRRISHDRQSWTLFTR